MLKFQRSPRVLCSACYRFGCRVDDIICLIHSRGTLLYLHYCWHRCRVFEFPRVVPISLIKHENWLLVVVYLQHGSAVMKHRTRYFMTFFEDSLFHNHNDSKWKTSFHLLNCSIPQCGDPNNEIESFFPFSCTRLCPVTDTIPRLIWILTFPSNITFTIKQPLFFFIFGAIRSQIKSAHSDTSALVSAIRPRRVV